LRRARIGPLTEFIYGSGDRKKLTYDTRYRVQTNELLRGTASVASYVYQYDPTGNITRINDQVDASFNRQFGYGDLGRLTSTSTGHAGDGAGLPEHLAEVVVEVGGGVAVGVGDGGEVAGNV
jgi:hypothetical protein